MLLFNTDLRGSVYNQFNLNTSHVIVQQITWSFLSPMPYNLNTSHVIVQPDTNPDHPEHWLYLNTSHVIVQRFV